MTPQYYILTQNDIQTIDKIYDCRLKSVNCLDDIYDIITLLNHTDNYEYGTFGYTKELECDHCLINGDNVDILFYTLDNKKYWLSEIIDLPEAYTFQWVTEAIQAVIKIIDQAESKF